MILGVGSGAVLAIAGGLFHLVNHTIYKSNLFLSLGSVEKKTGSNELNDLGGLARNMPITFAVALIGALSISGIPPFNGFFSKWMIYQGVLQRTAALTPMMQLWSLLCLILAVFGSALTLASFMKFIYAVFLGRTKADFHSVREAPVNQLLATGSLAFLCIVFGILAVPLPLKFFIYPIVEKLGPVDFLGTYQPLVILGLFFVAFLLGYGIFLLIRRIRVDDIYLGGMSADEKYHLQGTSFYNEIRRMQPLASIYQAAENKHFDVYDLGTRSTFSFAHFFQRIHAGWLPIYLLFLVVGLIVLLFLR
jgi:NADH:ubiquinone oxidoreductase subunit 5 (subunit L)/multisubunit Na+/H+ antiporter MnhA subunit